MPRYGIKTLLYIAENYNEFEAETSYNDKGWASDHWSNKIDTKVDFDRALKFLSPEEQKLIFDVNTLRTRERYELLRRMSNFLNRPSNFIGLGHA